MRKLPYMAKQKIINSSNAFMKGATNGSAGTSLFARRHPGVMLNQLLCKRMLVPITQQTYHRLLKGNILMRLYKHYALSFKQILLRNTLQGLARLR